MNSKAEGKPNEREQLEPVTALRTSTIPMIDEALGLSKSDTGLSFVVKSDADGHENNDTQDASLTLDESTYSGESSQQAKNSTVTSNLK